MDEAKYDKVKAECKCHWNIEVSTEARGLFYSYCQTCDKITDIRGYGLKNKIYWTLRLLGIIKRPLNY